MTYFGIAHLALGQTDVQTAAAQSSSRIISVELVVKWGPGEQGRVPIFFPPGTAAGVDAPAIPDNEHDGASHIRRTLPMISAIDKCFPRLRD